jgi:hypothetical protein
MAYSDLELDYIFGRTGGHCYQCGLALSRTEYDLREAAGAWSVSPVVLEDEGPSDVSTSVAACCIECARTIGQRVSPVEV